MTQPIKDVRKEYADELRQMADEIENSDSQPLGLYLYLWWQNEKNSICVIQRGEKGFPALSASGLLLKDAVELSQKLKILI